MNEPVWCRVPGCTYVRSGPRAVAAVRQHATLKHGRFIPCTDPECGNVVNLHDYGSPHCDFTFDPIEGVRSKPIG